MPVTDKLTMDMFKYAEELFYFALKDVRWYKFWGSLSIVYEMGMVCCSCRKYIQEHGEITESSVVKALDKSLLGFVDNNARKNIASAANDIKHSTFDYKKVVASLGALLYSRSVEQLYVSYFGSAEDYTGFEVACLEQLEYLKRRWSTVAAKLRDIEVSKFRASINDFQKLYNTAGVIPWSLDLIEASKILCDCNVLTIAQDSSFVQLSDLEDIQCVGAVSRLVDVDRVCSTLNVKADKVRVLSKKNVIYDAGAFLRREE